MSDFLLIRLAQLGIAEGVFSAKHPPLVMTTSQSNHIPATADESGLEDEEETASGALAVVPLSSVQENHPTVNISPLTSLVLERAEDAFRREQLPEGHQKQSYAYHDALLSVGGLVWACEFMPQSRPVAGTEQVGREETLAVAVHPAGSTRHKSGVILSGQGAVQIWLIPDALQSISSTSTSKDTSGNQKTTSKTGGKRKSGVKRTREEEEEENVAGSTSQQSSSSASKAGPSLAFCLGHQGLVTWDLKWCPDPSLIHTKPMRVQNKSETKAVETDGVLAFVTGDAKVSVVSVPKASFIFTSGASDQHQSSPEELCTLYVPPQFCISREMNGGSIACSVEWQRIAQPSHNPGSSSASPAGASAALPPQGLLLLVGCCDGQVSGWKVPSPLQGLQGLQGLFQVNCDISPIWTLSWCPPGCFYEGIEGIQGNTFATLSHSGMVKVWDLRDLNLPVHSHLMSRSPARDMMWTLTPQALTSVHEDGVLRQLVMDPTFYGTSKDPTVTSVFAPPAHSACIWSISYHSPLSCALYCGEDGLAGLMAVEAEYDNRKRLPHVAIGGFSGMKGKAHEDEVLVVLSPSEAAALSSSVLFSGGAYFGGNSSEKKIKALSNKLALPPTSDGPVGPVLKTEAQTLFACHLSPVVDHEGMVWAAYGGAAGLVRLQRIAILS